MTIAVGAIAAAAGLYFVLVSLGVLPPPGRKNPQAPLWIVLCAGLGFLLAGIAAVSRALVGSANDYVGDLPPSAPRWLRIMHYFMGLMMVGTLAAIGTWVAFGSGSRAFNVSAPLFEIRGGGETIGRVVFGIGAVITWLFFAVLAIRGARKLLGRSSR